jgi:putative spermidine/putrescine transport system substrate-binding protein
MVAGSGLSPWAKNARAAQASIIAVEWGGPWVETMKSLTAKQDIVDVSWELHTGGSSAILPKIKAAWPNPQYDLVSSWDPVYLSMANEGWHEPLDLARLPNVQAMPQEFLYKDSAGGIVNIPRSIGAFFFGYRADTVPFEIKSIDDLLDPRLKGQICWNGPSSGTSCWLVPLALHRGGDEHNLEPAWEFTKEVAKSGNIGRVASSEAEFINSITTGETSVAFWDAGGWMGVAKNFPTVFLTKVPDSRGLKTFMFQEGWVVLRSSANKDAVLEYVNWMSSPENNGTINEELGLGTTHPQAKVSERAGQWALKPEELKAFGYFPDWAHLSAILDENTKRFEKEIEPLF